MLAKPVIFQLKMLSDYPRLIIIVYEGLPTFSDNAMLEMQRFRSMCSGTVTVMKLVPPSFVLRMLSKRIAHRALFSDSSTGW